MKVNFNKLIFLPFVVLVTSASKNEWSHQGENQNTLNKQPNVYPQNSIVQTRLLSNKQPAQLTNGSNFIRITYDISSFDKTRISLKQINDFETLVNTLINFMKKFIKVHPFSGSNKFIGKTCNFMVVPKKDQIKGIEHSDLHLYFMHEDKITIEGVVNDDAMAIAGPCSKKHLQRPRFAAVCVRTNFITNSRNQNEFQMDLRILFHELLHVLGFSSLSFEDLKGSHPDKFNPIIRQKAASFLRSPNVLNTAKKYFGCKSLIGVPLSADGKEISGWNNQNSNILTFQEPIFYFIQNSHWNQESFPDEIMQPSPQDYTKVSLLTIAVLEDVGYWAGINANFAEPLNMENKTCSAEGYESSLPSEDEYNAYYCQGFCEYNGFCIRGICHCNPGYSGEHCQFKQKLTYKGKEALKCPRKKFANPDNTCKDSCPTGYYKNETINECSLCDFSCSQCNGPSQNHCTDCQFLTHLVGSTCISCRDDQYFNLSKKICENCQKGCLSCDSNGCSVCQAEFVLKDKKCIQNCNPPCLKCALNNPQLCLQCQEGYSFQGNSCYPCKKGTPCQGSGKLKL